MRSFERRTRPRCPASGNRSKDVLLRRGRWLWRVRSPERCEELSGLPKPLPHARERGQERAFVQSTGTDGWAVRSQHVFRACPGICGSDRHRSGP
jgi:hypothetical protein